MFLGCDGKIQWENIRIARISKFTYTPFWWSNSFLRVSNKTQCEKRDLGQGDFICVLLGLLSCIRNSHQFVMISLIL